MLVEIYNSDKEPATEAVSRPGNSNPRPGRLARRSRHPLKKIVQGSEHAGFKVATDYLSRS